MRKNLDLAKVSFWDLEPSVTSGTFKDRLLKEESN